MYVSTACRIPQRSLQPEGVQSGIGTRHDAGSIAKVPPGHVVAVYGQLRSSDLDEYLPTEQDSQAIALENGFSLGSAMNVPGEQHPTRPVEGGEGHPHNVRVKPLESNTLKKKKEHIEWNITCIKSVPDTKGTREKDAAKKRPGS